MAGHSKWKQIKERKGKTDAKRSQVFSKYAKLITNEARAVRSTGSGQANVNRDAPALRAAIERARKENMPNDNIERAVKKATESGGTFEAIMYEGYGPGGVALLVEVLTDSRNRSSNELKFILSEHGGNLASPGAARWAFQKSTPLPAPSFSHHPASEDGSAPLVRGDTTAPNPSLEKEGGQERWRATTTVALGDADLEKLDKLVEALEANEDVQEVFTNAE